ncbi:chromatin binding protein [Polyrhizophydium stewartii]|uniref:Chromatin binding protein n=1 Tax=Polyrhizophydium stewartii TaxID=2732419 RepID=A0ABR4NGR1_9FUNG
MNLELQGTAAYPFGQYFPQTIFDRLADPEASTTTICAFNRRATLMAAGTRDGRCLVWDLDTRSIILRLKGHAQPITSVSWSRRGRHVLTSSRDWNCILWDLKLARRRLTVRFGSPVLEARMHPRNRSMFLAIAQGDPPYLVQFSSVPGRAPRRIVLDLTPSVDMAAAADSTVPPAKTANTNSGEVFATTAIFSVDGSLIFVGTTRGHIAVFESNNGTFKTILRPGTSSINHLCCSRHGTDLLVNAHDRIIRCFKLQRTPTDEAPENDTLSIELVNKFQDSVDRNQWCDCTFSADGEMVVGAMSSTQQHNVFIWDKNLGNLVKMLEGPREGIASMVWHPFRPIIASISHTGTIYFWGVMYTQNFSAFAPFFTELEENIEYQEREDEFDDVDPNSRANSDVRPESPKEPVDVDGGNAITGVSDTDDGGWDTSDFSDLDVEAAVDAAAGQGGSDTGRPGGSVGDLCGVLGVSRRRRPPFVVPVQ